MQDLFQIDDLEEILSHSDSSIEEQLGENLAAVLREEMQDE